MQHRVTKLAAAGWLLYWAVLFAATHIPTDDAKLDFPSGDKLAHVAGYALLALLAAVTLRAARWPPALVNAVVLLGSAAYGAVDEWTQAYAGRQPDFYDWVADVTGAVLGLVIFASAHRWLRRLGRGSAARGDQA